MLSVEIRNHPTLLDSLEQYVKGELLEGGDAYHCDKCDKKVTSTVFLTYLTFSYYNKLNIICSL